MAQNWQSETYKSQVAAKGGRWDSGGAATTQNTWGTEQVDPSQWQSGGWYTNPNTGYVERWWADGGGGNGGSNGGNGSSGNGGGAFSNNFASAFNNNNNAQQATAEVKLPEAPKINLQERYNTLYTSLGLQGFKDKVNEIQGQIVALRDQTDQAAALINENPWSSAANRTGRLAKLEDAYNRKASVLSQQAALEQQKYQEAMGELNTQMSLYTDQYNYDLNAFENNLSRLNTYLDMGALDNASQDSLVNMAAQTGLSADMIQSMINANKRRNMKPTLIQNTDDYGNVTATLIDVNTGNVLNQQRLGQIDASRLTPTSLSGGYSSSGSRVGSGNASAAGGIGSMTKGMTTAQKAQDLAQVAEELYVDNENVWTGAPQISQFDNFKELYYIWVNELGGTKGNFKTYFGNYALDKNWFDRL